MTDIKQYEPLWGSWHVESLIGEGSYGKVYKIRKDEFGKTYHSAVKILSIPPSEVELKQVQSEGMDDASARSYFHAFVTDIIQEIDLMSAFRGNSNIVSLEDHKVIERENEIGWDILIRMELLSTLSDYVTEKPMTPDGVVKLGIHICRALELCSVKRTIHRDIKPDNIFVSQYGEFKLGDFGIARQIDRTMSGLSKKGTYTYMAPEVFKGEEYGATVDTYSLGIVMYRFLNKNRAPFLPNFPEPITPNARDEALQRRMSGEPLPYINEIEPALSNIVLKACAFERDGRFTNATEMREALESLAGGAGYAPVSLDVGQVAVTKLDTRRTQVGDRLETEATESVFADREAFFAEKPQEEEAKPEIPQSLIKKLSLTSCISFALLCVFCLLSGDKSDLFSFLPIYALCVAQSVLKFSDDRFNAVFLAILLGYSAYAFFIAFGLFDYHIFALACGMIPLLAGRKREHRFMLVTSCILVVCAIVSGVLASRSINGVAAGLYHANVTGAVAVPVFLLLTALLCLLLTSENEKLNKYAAIGFIALQFFPIAIFTIHVLSSHMAGFSPYDKIDTLFHIANADFTGFSTDRFKWWTNWRFIGQILQTAAFTGLFGLGVIRVYLDAYIKKKA